jgi:hypothetical protein
MGGKFMNLKRIFSLVLAFTMLISTAAFAATVPNETIVIGDAAYDLQALADDNFTEEILGKYLGNEAEFYFKNPDGEWVNSLNKSVEPNLPSTITLKKGDGTVEVIEIGEEEPPAELKVVEISAIDDINVEFGGEYTLPAEVEVTLSDGTVVSVPVIWDETGVDVNVAGTYVVVGTLDLSALENVEATDKTASVNVIVAEEVRIPATLTTEAEAIINAVVGDEVSVTYTVKDANDKAVKNEDVRVRAKSFGTVVEEQVLTTDENGQVTFSYTSIDGRTDLLEAVVLSKPTLRNTAVTVEWVETAAKVEVVNPTADGFLVNTAAAATAKPELATIKYVATFIDADGNPLADGEVVTVELNGFTGTLTGVGDNEFTGSGTTYTATLANGDGTAVLEFTTNTAEKIQPTFYYDADASGYLTSQDPRIVAKEVEVVNATTQEPTFTLELKEVDEDNGINTAVEEVDGVLQVQVGSTVEYTLTAVDQYGNPFIGTAQLSHKNLLDNLAGNDGNEGLIDFAVDEVGGGDTTAATSVNFDTEDTNADGTIELRVQNGNVGDFTNLVVWFDADGDGKLDADETSVESQTIEFVAVPVAVLTSMDITANLTTVVADGTNKVTYTVELLDADGNAFNASSSNVDVIVELYQDGEKLDQNSSATTVDGLGTLNVGTYVAATSTNENVLITGINAANGKFDFTVLPAAADAGSSFYPVVTVDVNKDGEIQSDETITVQGAAFTATALPNSYEATLSKTNLVAGETVDITITALDSSNDIEVNFDGEYIVKVEILDGSSSTLRTYNRKANFVDGVATASVPVELVSSNKIKVTMPLGTSNTATTVEVLTVEAAAASALAVNASNELFVADEFGNKVDYDFEGLATVTTDGTFSGTLDDENTMVLSIVDGDLKEGSTALTFTGSAGDTLTIELSNGDSFSITL